MRKLILAIAIISLLFGPVTAYSQEPSPPLAQGEPREIHPDSSKKNNINAKNNEKTAGISEPITNPSKHTNQKNATTQKAREKNNKAQLETGNDGSITTYTFWLAILTGILVICNVVLCVFNFMALRVTKKSADAAKEAADAAKESTELVKQGFIATHRPKLRVHSIYLEKLDPPPEGIANGSYITYRLYCSIDNIGGSIATIIKKSLTFKRLKNPFPVPSYSAAEPVEKAIACGESVIESVGVEDALIWASSDSAYDDLHFFGYFDYRDDIGTTRRTAFCRLHNRKTKRFTKIEDEDYEYSY